MLDPASPLPLYHQLARWLEGRVEQGELQNGDRIESEPALARQFGVGRPTVRQATELLVRRGLLERRRGAGTFVRTPPPSVDLFGLGGTLAGFRQSGVEVQTRTLAPLERSGTQLRLTRLHIHRDAPVVLEEVALDAGTFGALEGRNFERASLSQAVRGDLGLRLDHAEQSFQVALADGERSRWLDVPRGTPLLQVTRTLFFGGAGPAARATLHCRTEELRFTQTLQGDTAR